MAAGGALLAAIGAGSGVALNALADIADTSRRVAEWGAAMVRAHYRTTVERYETFEPLARGFARIGQRGVPTAAVLGRRVAASGGDRRLRHSRFPGQSHLSLPQAGCGDSTWAIPPGDAHRRWIRVDAHTVL